MPENTTCGAFIKWLKHSIPELNKAINDTDVPPLSGLKMTPNCLKMSPNCERNLAEIYCFDGIISPERRKQHVDYFIGMCRNYGLNITKIDTGLTLFMDGFCLPDGTRIPIANHLKNKVVVHFKRK